MPIVDTAQTIMDRGNTHSRRSVLGSIAAAGTLTIAGCASTGDGEFPSDSITFVVPFGEGGGVDRSTREIQPVFEDELGTSLRFEYHPGAGTQIGQRTVLDANDDGYTIGAASLPAFNFTMIVGDAQYELDDFGWIGNLLRDPGLMRMHKDEDRFDNIEDVFDYARDNPGDLTVSTSGPYNQNVLGLALLQEATGAEFNIVPFDGGGDARSALVREEVDLVHANVFNSLGTADSTEVLAVHAEENEWADLTDDAPTFSDALGFNQEEVPTEAPEVVYSWYTSSEAADNHPDRFETLVDAFGNAVQSDEYKEELESLDPPQESKRLYRPPDETANANEEKHEQMESYIDLIEAAVDE